MSKSEQLESLLRQVQQRRTEPRSRNRRPVEAAPPQTQTQPKPPSRPRPATPLEQAASKASGFAPRPPSSPPSITQNAEAVPSFDSPTAKYPNQPARAKAAPAAPVAAPVAAPAEPAKLKAEKVAVPAAARGDVAQSVGQRPAAKTFGELITRALALRAR